MALADDVLEALTRAPALSTWIGQVTAIATPKVTCTVAGGSLTLPRLASYTTPAVGDVVLVLATPGAWIVLGKIA